jgi:hypothetical protein
MLQRSATGFAWTRTDVPVYRFRAFDDARRALWIASGDPALPDRLRRLWRFTSRLASGVPRRGVQRFRTIEDANAERDRRVQERVDALRASRRAAPPVHGTDRDARCDGA